LDLVGQVVEEANGLRLALPGRLEVERLAYFGVSVAWRASVAECVPGCKLSADHEESLRRYLLRQSPFPDDVTCFVKFHDLPFGSEAVTSIYTLPTTTGEECRHRPQSDPLAAVSPGTTDPPGGFVRHESLG
jgi:hypothetical protein